jgi:hypothetical protein
MELYVGMDVSLKETSICVVDGKGGLCQTNANQVEIVISGCP